MTSSFVAEIDISLVTIIDVLSITFFCMSAVNLNHSKYLGLEITKSFNTCVRALKIKAVDCMRPFYEEQE